MTVPRAFVFGHDLWDPSHRFETSWLFSPWVFGALRAVFALYILVTQVFVEVWVCGHAELGGCALARNEFSYFTVLTYWGLGFYYAIAAVHTLTYARSGAPLLDRFPRPLQALHSAFYTTVIVFPFIVTGVYWGLLYDGRWYPDVFDAWSNVSRHAMNSGFALFEIVFARTNPPPLVHVLILVVLLGMYLGLAYITHATKGFYVYTFLDPADGRTKLIAYVLGIALGSIIVFCLAWGAIKVRLWVTEKQLGMEGKFAGPPSLSRGAQESYEDLEMSDPQPLVGRKGRMV